MPVLNQKIFTGPWGKTAYILAIMAIVLLIIFAIYNIYNGDRMAPDEALTDPTAEWQTYRNDDYNFVVSYPPDWAIASGTRVITPMISIYPTVQAELPEPPFDHFADAIHVSIYPEGIPTEGVSGEVRSTEVSFSESVKEARDYILSNGEVWATMAVFDNPPVPWKEWGYIFARAPIDDLRTECVREGTVITEEQCDPLFGDQIIRYGQVDESIRAVEKRIMESFRFMAE